MSARTIRTHAALASLLCVGLLSSAEAGTLGKSTIGTTNYPMSFQGRLALEPADSSAICSTVLDGQVFLGTTAARVIQVDLDSLKRVKSIDVGLQSRSGIRCAGDGGSIFFTTNTGDKPTFLHVTKVDLQSLSVVARKEIDIGFGTISPHTAAADGFLYVGVNDVFRDTIRAELGSNDNWTEFVNY